jgi:hypothetical protein
VHAAVSQQQTPPAAVNKVVLNNDDVVVTDSQFLPGAVDKMTARSKRIVYVIKGPQDVTFTFADGTTQASSHQAADAIWYDKGTSSITNMAPTPLEVLVVALKH